MENTKNNILEGSVFKGFVKFSLPILFALILQALYGVVDLFTVGRFASTADISAVAIGSQTILIITGFLTGLATGVTVVLGKKIGEKDYKGAIKTITSSVILFILLGILLSILMIFLAKPIAILMNTPKEALDPTVKYIQICGGGIICIASYNLLSAIFRGLGDSKSPLLFVFIAAIINIFGDLILIYSFKMGAAGAAIATIASQGISVLLSIIYFKFKKMPFPFEKENIKIEKNTLKNIIKIGLPIGFQDFCSEISYLLLFAFVNVLGLTASAGVGIAEKIVVFVLLIPNTFMQSISAMVAQNIGANNLKRADKILKTGLILAVLLGAVVSLITFFFGENLSAIFIDKTIENASATIKDSGIFLKATSIECFLFCIAYCFMGYLNGRGKTKFVMIQGLCAIFLVKLPYLYFATYVMEPNLFNMGLALVFSALFSLIICLIYFLIFKHKKRDT
jgi:putative MATE family efflux protein